MSCVMLGSAQAAQLIGNCTADTEIIALGPTFSPLKPLWLVSVLVLTSEKAEIG